MTRFENITKFIDQSVKNDKIIEPNYRKNLNDEISDVINIHNPGIVVKIGIGGGDYLLKISEKAKYTAAIEPSSFLIERFVSANQDKINFKKINIINSSIEALPLNYYCADLFVCLDYFDFLDVGALLDEFSRCIQFEGLLLLGTVVLDNEDTEGVYDELSRTINPIHNDFYLSDDLITMMGVKKFTLVKKTIHGYKRNLKEDILFYENYSKSIGVDSSKKSDLFLSENLDVMKKLYEFNTDDYSYTEKYMLSLFRKNRYEE